MEEIPTSERMKIREKQADITNGKNSPFITMDRRVWLDYADEVFQLETKIVSYREAYEQAVETAWQGESVRLPDLDDMLAWIEEKR